LARAHSWLDRHPGVGDTALAVVLLGASVSTLFDEQSNAGIAGFVFSVLLIAPLALRRLAPVVVFGAVMLACGVEPLFLDEFIAANLAALVALYTLVAYASRPWGAVGFAVAAAGAVPFALHFDDFSSSWRRARRACSRRRRAWRCIG
jgi:hypothetical protein